MSVQTASQYTTAPAAAFNGMLADDTENDCMTFINADSVSMSFGSVVAFKTSSPASDKDVILPAASSAKLAGIIVQEHDIARQFVSTDAFGNTTTNGEIDATGYTVGSVMACLWRGTIWVQVQQAVVPGDRLFVCYNPDGTVYTVKGQSGNADVSSNALDATAIGRFTSGAKAGGLAKLQVDFSQKN